jgi:mRNA-degrading endonuclease RelE of RelBE toxin-antitoxin system
MLVIQTRPVEIALRTLGDEERRKVVAWLDHLENWENDPFIRRQSQRIGVDGDLFVLKTNTEYRIFFQLEPDRIVVLDVATVTTLRRVARSVRSRGHGCERGTWHARHRT